MHFIFLYSNKSHLHLAQALSDGSKHSFTTLDYKRLGNRLNAALSVEVGRCGYGVLVGWHHPFTAKVLDTFRMCGRDVLILTDGVVEKSTSAYNRDFIYSVAVNGPGPYGKRLYGRMPGDRLHKIRIEPPLRPFIPLTDRIRGKGPSPCTVTIAHQSGLTSLGESRANWFHSAINSCLRHGHDVNLVIRTHPAFDVDKRHHSLADILTPDQFEAYGSGWIGHHRARDYNLDDDLSCTDLFITHGSKAAVKSILYGIPTVVGTEYAWTAGVSAYSPTGDVMALHARDQLDAPFADRYTWACWLSYQQWDADDMASGALWDYFGPKLNLK